jgi:hypothetical protein
MGFFSRLGNKIASGVKSATRIGKKALGTIHRVGNKIATQGEKIVSGVERIPVLGSVLAPATGVVRSGIGLVKNVSELAGRGEDMIDTAEDIVRRGGEALKTGNVAEATDVLKRGKQLVGTGKSTLERAKEVKNDAVKLASRSM